MHTDTRDLIDRLTANVVQTHLDERQLRATLLAADETERTEIAYYVEDSVMAHHTFTGLNLVTSIEKIEEYIASQIKVADWHVRHNEMLEEWEDLPNRDIASLLLDEVLDDLDNADTSGHA